MRSLTRTLSRRSLLLAVPKAAVVLWVACSRGNNETANKFLRPSPIPTKTFVGATPTQTPKSPVTHEEPEETVYEQQTKPPSKPVINEKDGVDSVDHVVEPAQQQVQHPTATKESPQEFAQLVITRNGQSLQTLQVELVEQSPTVWRILEIAQELYGVEIAEDPMRGGKFGRFVYSIGGLSNNENQGSWWFLYLNSTFQLSGASVTTVSPGDLIAWDYQG